MSLPVSVDRSTMKVVVSLRGAARATVQKPMQRTWYFLCTHAPLLFCGAPANHTCNRYCCCWFHCSTPVFGTHSREQGSTHTLCPCLCAACCFPSACCMALEAVDTWVDAISWRFSLACVLGDIMRIGTSL